MAQIKNSPGQMPLLPLQAFMYISPCLAGLYHEWSACFAALYLLGWLLYVQKTQKELLIPKNLSFLALTVIPLFYGLSTLWAVDRGMAVLGFVKFLPLPLFALAVYPLDRKQRDDLLQTVPLSGAIMTVFSLLLGQFPPLADSFLINGRLAGFFQYPNTFAMYLLAGVILILARKKFRWKELVYLILLLAGIALSGSRTVFFLLLAAVIYYFFSAGNKALRLTPVILLVLLTAATVLYAAVSGDLSSAARYLTASLSSSTFMGRLLYFRDALPQILAHPFGLGYMGYHYTLGSFQTGVYSLIHVHNDLLQLMLDIGWLPAILLVWALAKSLLSGNLTKDNRVLLLALCAHALFDFDFQYILFWFLLILVTDLDAGTAIRLPAGRVSAISGGLLAAVCVYFAAASGLHYLNAHAAAVRLYPGYTESWYQLLTEAEDADSMDTIADRILKRNSHLALAHSAKARVAYTQGDFGAMIEHKTAALSLVRYDLDEYLDYFDMLSVGIDLYTRAGDTASAEYCRQELLAIPIRMAKVMNETSSLGLKIDDLPDLRLPDEYIRRMAEYQNR